MAYKAELPLMVTTKPLGKHSEWDMRTERSVLKCDPTDNPAIEALRKKLRAQKFPHTETVETINGIECAVFCQAETYEKPGKTYVEPRGYGHLYRRLRKEVGDAKRGQDGFERLAAWREFEATMTTGKKQWFPS